MTHKTDESIPVDAVSRPEKIPFAAARLMLERRPRRMLRAPFRSRVLSDEEIKELLSYAPKP